MTRNYLLLQNRRLILAAYIASATISVLLALFWTNSAQAACAIPTTDLGKVTYTINVQTAGTYRVHSRIKAPDATANSYNLEIDGGTCHTVGDASIAANTWTWVNYKNGASSSFVDVTLTAGNHTVVAIGREAGVKLDRIIMTTNFACAPDGTGDNCAVDPDITPPTVAITSPANNTTISSTTAIQATATDNTGGGVIAKVEFLVDGVIKGSADTVAPYSYQFDPTQFTPGNHVIVARATDNSGNVSNSSAITVIVPVPPDTTKPTVSLTTPVANAQLSGTVAFTATAADPTVAGQTASGVQNVEFLVDGVVKSSDTSSPYAVSIDSKTIANGAHTIAAKAYDVAGNNQTTTAINVNVNNVVNPPLDTEVPNVSITNPTAGATISNTYTIAATATDNIGVTRVEFYVDGVLKTPADTTPPYTFNIDTKTLTNASHTFSAKAFDAAGNTKTSVNVSATVNNKVIWNEDIDSNGCVDPLDFNILARKFNQTVTQTDRANIDRSTDNLVGPLDFNLLARKFNQCSP